jgi:hypothetical protein
LKKSTFPFKAFVDSTEQEIPRPKNKKRRKSYYSGRRKEETYCQDTIHGKQWRFDTIYTKQVMSVEERIHDYEIFKNKPPLIPLQVENVLDLGYMGV